MQHSTLYIKIDEGLAPAFDSLIPLSADSTTSSRDSPYFCTNSRVSVSACRCQGVAAESILLFVADDAPTNEGGTRSAEEGSLALANSAIEKVKGTLYLVLMMDAKQVSPFLSAATASRCPPHPSGSGPIGWYLDAVRDAFIGDDEAVTDAVAALPELRNGGCPLLRRLHLTLIITPNVSAAVAATTNGYNVAHPGITAKELTSLFSAVTSWGYGQGLRASVTAAAGAASVQVGQCTTATHPQHAVRLVVALANKLLKELTSPPRGAVVEVRPDTQRKCLPDDFRALYTSMLMEVTSYSQRRAMATVSAFPTICHLLEYVDTYQRQCTSSDAAADDRLNLDDRGEMEGTPLSSPTSASWSHDVGVYTVNYGESRRCNVVNDAILDAFVTKYQ